MAQLSPLMTSCSSHWLGVISGMFDYLSAGGEVIPFAIIPTRCFCREADE